MGHTPTTSDIPAPDKPQQKLHDGAGDAADVFAGDIIVCLPCKTHWGMAIADVDGVRPWDDSFGVGATATDDDVVVV